jgi:hypothetical protein
MFPNLANSDAGSRDCRRTGHRSARLFQLQRSRDLSLKGSRTTREIRQLIRDFGTAGWL